MDRRRFLTIIADDFGIGPATSQGILDLAARRLLGGAVFLVNGPHAEESVRAWRHGSAPLELGWHPCLTLDAPVLPPRRVPSLVGADGRFRPLGQFLKCLVTGVIRPDEIAAELEAQYRRFRELVGHPPGFINAHHHVHVFAPVGSILLDLVKRQRPLPYLRKVREPWSDVLAIPGARIKRVLLGTLGRWLARRQESAGLPGNDWLAGVTDPWCVTDPQFFVRWIRRVPGRIVELACHPGHIDPTLVGRDCTLTDGMLLRRVREFQLLRDPAFLDAVREAGFCLAAPSELNALFPRGTADAA